MTPRMQHVTPGGPASDSRGFAGPKNRHLLRSAVAPLVERGCRESEVISALREMALEAAAGNLTHAAARIGISRRSMTRYISGR